MLKRGTALGIAATGISASGVIMPAISAWLIATLGWREGFLAYGIITLVIVVPIVLRFVISGPEELGLLPDGETEQTRLPPVKPPLRTRDFLGTANFWVLVLIIGLLFCIQSATLVHMVPRLTDDGLSLVAASFIASATAAFGIAGKLIYGVLVDRWDVRHALWMGIAFQVAGQLLMLFVPGYLGFLAGACLFGFGMGGIVPMQSAIVGVVFGRASFGRVLGAMRPPMSLLHVAGVPFAGWIYDVTGELQAGVPDLPRPLRHQFRHRPRSPRTTTKEERLRHAPFELAGCGRRRAPRLPRRTYQPSSRLP
ncbi:MAG: MFS transporter [Gammaproteobacteria bacterium]|nr:MFS transporter [Gammaproteobacteria bacterium]